MAKRYKLIYEKAALKALRNFSPVIQKRIGIKLEFFLAHENPLAFARELTKTADAEYRFRVGDYRVLFDVIDAEIIIIYIHHRRDAYKKRS